MKFVFMSDIHGSMGYAKLIPEVLERENADKLVLLGDLYYHGPRNPFPLEYNPAEVAKLLNGLKEKLLVVKGNCDAEVDEMISEFKFEESVVLECAGKKIFCTHGHKFNEENLPKDDFDILIFGHFHVGKIEEVDGKILANAGSLSLPKNDSPNSYLVFDGEKLVLKDLNGKVLKEKKF